MSVSRFHLSIFKISFESLGKTEIVNVEKDAAFKSQEQKYRANQSQRKRNKEAAELARLEETAKQAEALVAKMTQDRTDE